jgi:RNA polymerase sigma-70 factor (ECF subfamily)
MDARAWILGLKGRTADLVPAAIDWEAVYAEQLPHIYSYFFVRTADRALAEDLTSLTFEKAWRGRHGYRPERAALATWLLVIARNVAASHFRRPSGAELSLDGVDVTSPAIALDEMVQRQDDLARLRRLVADLPEREREIVALKYGAGLTNREIAKLTGLSESNTGTLLHRTVQRLRAAWGTAP